MDDFISREDTIEKMEEVDWYHQNKNGEMVHGANPAEHQAWYKAEDVYKVLEDMPDVRMTTGACWGCQCEKMEKLRPERERGKWIPISDGYVDIYECNQCGDTEDYERNFCPNCGEDMR